MTFIENELQIVRPGDAGWDEARQAWNLAVDQRPAAVARPRDAGEVAAALAFAKREGLKVAVQATGHGAPALGGAQDGTLLLKVDRLGSVEIDAAARTARVGAGALWGDVAVQAGAHGLAALHGSSIDVGVVGYTLGGGIGWLSREHGLASEHVTAIELVTADGELRRLTADGDAADGELRRVDAGSTATDGSPHRRGADGDAAGSGSGRTAIDRELFWALRGGGGGFGVVTALEFGLVPLTHVYAGTLFWPGELAREVFNAYREWAANAPDEVTSTIRLLHLPDLPFVPEPLRDRPVVDVCVSFAGEEADGEALVAPLRAVAPPLIDTLGTIPAPQLVRLHGDPEQPVPGLGHHTVLRELTPAAIDALVETAGHASGSPLLGVELRQLGGALGRKPANAGALGAIDGAYIVYGIGSPRSPESAQAIAERLDLVVGALAPWSTGGAFLNMAERPDGAAARAFDAPTRARLDALKAAIDPDALLVTRV
jgi:hypothetical protein